jgi:hypothetical protein
MPRTFNPLLAAQPFRLWFMNTGAWDSIAQALTSR